MQGVSTLRRSVSEETKFFRKSEDFAGNPEGWEIVMETQSNKVKISGRYFSFLGGLLFTHGPARHLLLELQLPSYISILLAFAACTMV